MFRAPELIGMSLGIYPVFNPKVSDATFEALGEALAAEFETLDRLADQHGLVRLTSFADTRQVPDGFDGSPEELEGVMGPWDEWFSCRDGQLAFEKLARLLAIDSAAAQTLEAPEAVSAELMDLARVVAVGEARGARFRLEMS